MKLFWALVSLLCLALGVGMIALKVQARAAGGYLEALPYFDYCAQGRKLLAQNQLAEAVDMAKAGGCDALAKEARAQSLGARKLATRCFRGAWVGRSEDVAGASCALVSDFFVVGDLRDLTRQGVRFAKGEKTDYFLAALSGAGIALTVLPEMDLGVNVVKFARRSGTLSEPLAKSTTKLIGTKAWPELRAMMTDVGHLTRTQGVRQATTALRYADSPKELSALSKFVAKKPHALLALKWGGKGARNLTDDALYQAAFAKGPAGIKLALKKGHKAFLKAHPLMGVTKGIYKGNAEAVLLWAMRFLSWNIVALAAGLCLAVGALGLWFLLPQRKIPKTSRTSKPSRWGFVPFTRSLSVLLIIASLGVVAFPLSAAAKDTFTPVVPEKLLSHTGAVTALSFSPQGDVLASAGADKTINLWSSGSWTIIRHFVTPKPTRSLAFSADGKVLAAGLEDGTLMLWDTASWQLKTTFRAHTLALSTLAFSPAGILATAGEDKTTVAPGRFSGVSSLLRRQRAEATLKAWQGWDATPVKTLLTDTSLTSPITSLAFNREGSSLFGATESGRLEVFDAATLQPVQQIDAAESPITALALSPDGSSLAIATAEQSPTLWNTTTWQRLEPPLGAAGARILAFASAANLLASAQENGEVTLQSLQPRSSQQRERFQADLGAVRALNFRPQGDILAVAGSNGAIRLQPVLPLERAY